MCFARCTFISRGRRYWENGDLDFDVAMISFFLDVSRRTLAHRRALRPVTKALKEADINYRWGFPFHLYVGKSHSLCSPADLEAFCFIWWWMTGWTLCCPPGAHCRMSSPLREIANSRLPFLQALGRGCSPQSSVITGPCSSYYQAPHGLFLA